MLDRAKSQFGHVIVEAPQELAIETLMEIFRRSCSGVSNASTGRRSLFELNLLCREADARGHRGIAIKPLIYLERLENAHGLSGYIEETLQRPVHSYLRAGDATQFTGIFVAWVARCVVARSGSSSPRARRAASLMWACCSPRRKWDRGRHCRGVEYGRVSPQFGALATEVTKWKGSPARSRAIGVYGD